MKKTCTMVLLLALMAPSCEMSDGDRCPDGYLYDAQRRFCIVDTGGDGDTGSDTDSDTDSDTESDTDEPPTGMGEYCQSDEDCAEYEADFCGVNPLSGDGYCTIEGCEMGACPAGYQCCDCTSSSMLSGIACLQDSDATLAGGMGGCTCQ